MIVLGYSGFTRDLRKPGAHASPLSRTALTFDNLFRFRGGEVPFPLFPLGFFGHDGAAALVVDGEVVACAAEERFTRVKHSLNLIGNTLLPRHAARFCLERAGVDVDAVDAVAHYCEFDPNRVVERASRVGRQLRDADTARLKRSYEDVYESMLSNDAVLAQAELLTGRPPRRLVRVRHHAAHAASAYYPSGFDEALILTIDGSGEVESSMLATGRGREIEVLRRTHVPTSLGALYLIITVFLGFRSLGDEYKVMGLAPYGDPSTHRSFFEHIVESHDDGTYSTDLLADPGLQGALLDALGPARAPDAPIERAHADVAAALQEAVERAVLCDLERARNQTGIPRLCLAGGVALNCTLNGAIARSGLFDDVFVQPAAGDDGAALGAALSAWRQLTGGDPRGVRWRHVAWGPEFSNDAILVVLRSHEGAVRWTRVPDIAGATAERLAAGDVVGWFQGRMEFGPRALGNRSILADPRSVAMRDRVNETVKHREGFRPFAPAVLEESADAYFDLCGMARSPFMLFAVPVHEDRRTEIPAVTHVDGSARVQTVARDVSPLFWAVIDAFRARTGVPVVLNTSFNVMHEPIVCSPEDALRCFLGTDMDALAIGDYLVSKEDVA